MRDDTEDVALRVVEGDYLVATGVRLAAGLASRNDFGAGAPMGRLGERAAFRGDALNARQRLQRALKLAAEVADLYIEAIALINLGVVDVVEGGIEKAVGNLGRALQSATALRST